MRCDLKLVGGEVIDGTGERAFRADVGITGDEISALGDLGGLEAGRTIDCAGKTITPGFIDIHSHADWLVPWPSHASLLEPFIRQGMTSAVGGNCGFSPAPVTDQNRASLNESGRLFSDADVPLQWETMGQFLDSLDANGLALNLAQLVGHGTLRAGVTGFLTMDAPDPDELLQMERLTKQALADGCIGVSTGLGYPPGIFSQRDELVAFAGWVAREGKLLTSHLRAYSAASGVYPTDPEVQPHNLRAVEDILDVATAAGSRLQISHLIFVGRTTWPTAPQVIDTIEKARGAGLDVAFDAFPYTAGNTTASVLFPPEMLPRLETILQDPEQMAGLRAFAAIVFEQLGFGLDDIQIMDANAPGLRQYNGLYVDDAAERAGMDIWDFYARMVIDSRRNARVLIHKYSGEEQDESALRAVLAHPLCTFETDTFVTDEGHQNPASYGTFPRILSTYVDRGLFRLEEAVFRMTGASAMRLGWTDRGWIRRGCAADVVVLDRGSLRDTATFAEPDRFPEGIEHVFINGRHVVEHDAYDAGALAGRVLRA